MTAKAAANALMTYDVDLIAQVEALNTGDYWWIQEGARESQAEVIRNCAGTFTLSIAAASARVSERQVLVALAQHHLHCGTYVCAKGAVITALSEK